MCFISTLGIEDFDLFLAFCFYICLFFLFNFCFVAGEMRSLTRLGANENHLNELPKEIQHLTNLQLLDLRFNRLSTLPPEIGKLTALKKLFLRFNKLVKIPDEIGNLKLLEVFSVRNNRLALIPDTVSNLVNLEILDVQHNQISHMPPVSDMLKLTSLDVQYNCLQALPEGVWNLTKLTGLHVKYNQIKEIPSNLLLNMGGLEELDFEGNKLCDIPAQMQSLKSLKKLYISRNNISDFPAEFGSLRCVEELYINDNNISSLAEIVNLSTLRVLNMSNNNIMELPREITRLSVLRVIAMFIALLKEMICLMSSEGFSSSFLLGFDTNPFHSHKFRLAIIQELNFGANYLKHLIPEIGALKNLTHLELNDNALEDIPTEIADLVSLQVLNLEGTLLLPMAFIGLCFSLVLSILIMFVQEIN